MATWAFTPQEVLAESLAYEIERAETLGRGVTASGIEGNAHRRFRLRYALVTSADCYAMRMFFTARQGSFGSFEFLNPVDLQTYTVRFSAGLSLQHLAPVYFAAGGEIVLEVVPA